MRIEILSLKMRTNNDVANPYDFETPPQPLHSSQEVAFHSNFLFNVMVSSKHCRLFTCMKATSIQVETRQSHGPSTSQGLLSPADLRSTKLRETNSSRLIQLICPRQMSVAYRLNCWGLASGKSKLLILLSLRVEQSFQVGE